MVPGVHGVPVNTAPGPLGHGWRVAGWPWRPGSMGAGGYAMRGPVVAVAPVGGGGPQRLLKLCYRRYPGHSATFLNSEPIGS